MNITIEYRNPSPSHCEVVVWINGGNAGTLTLRQDELISFQTILASGMLPGDKFLGRGDPTPPQVNK